MSNKKRIRKLIKAKYKPSRKTRWNWFLQYMARGIPVNTGRVRGKNDFINKINKEYLKQLQTTSRADFQRDYMNYPIPTDEAQEIRYISEKPLIAIADVKYLFISSI
ncbi:hypothetical protein [Chryseobacterium sp.]|uniref:hypothetical protein n=1 Tax=Chryseobacterium sp. TaxID=1871047 RepID=UPI00289E8F34|nr:hypothetical protein [Chryseobacterium sp.]